VRCDRENWREVTDDEEFYRAYGLAHEVFQAADLDFVQLATVQSRSGSPDGVALLRVGVLRCS
jgi:hypothetical protein